MGIILRGFCTFLEWWDWFEVSSITITLATWFHIKSTYLTAKSDEVYNLIDIQISDTHTQIFPFSILSFTNHFLNIQILKAFLFTLLFWFFLLFNRKFSTFCLLYAGCSAIQKRKCDKSLWKAGRWNIRIEGLSLSYLMTVLILYNSKSTILNSKW